MKIVLQTRNGLDIDNDQCRVLSPFEENYGSQVLERKYGGRTGFTFRSEPTGMYNCHGLVFASRRTCICDQNEIHKIIEDDGYVEVPRAEVKPGDTVLYFSESGGIEHSAIVISATDFVPIVLSKIGKWKEAIHPANAILEYPFTNAKYYRIRD